MNKKEVSEIKKQFTFNNSIFNINKINVFYIQDKKIISKSCKKFADLEDFDSGSAPANCWDETEELCFFEIFKKTLGGQVGKSLVEYNFPAEIISDSDSQYSTLNNVYINYNKENVNKYVDFLIKNLDIEQNYSIFCTKCDYNVPKKENGIKEAQDFADDFVYSFLIFSICFVDKSKPQLEVKYSKDEIGSLSTFRQISVPQLGFLYPTFNDRLPDAGSVLIYNKNIKEPNISLVENCLGCTFELQPEEELKRFNNLLTKINNDIKYDLSKNIHQTVSDIIEKTSVNTEITEFSSNDIKNILIESGVEETALNNFDELYQEEIGKYNLKAVNLVTNKKMDIKSTDISISVKNESLDKISSKTINGNKYLLIELNENIEINGMNVSI